MLWLYFALIAYLINASVFIIDKYLLHVHIQKPFSYAFGIAILSLGALILIPFGVMWHGWQYFLISVGCGAVFFIALFFLYKSIKMSDITTASTQVGAISAIFTYFLSVLLLGQTLSVSSNIAFLFLLFGIIFLGKSQNKIFGDTIIAGALFGLYFVLIKISFNASDYVNGLFWTRIGFVGAAILSLMISNARKEIYNTFKISSYNSKKLFVANKIVSGIGFLLLYWAIRLGNVSIVNSMLGLQFLFTLVLAAILKNRISGLMLEFDRKTIMRKIIGVGFVVIGFIFLHT